MNQREFEDARVIVKILKECGPMTYHKLLVQACAEGVDPVYGFDKALMTAINVCFVKGQFAACTKEEQDAHHKRSVHPTFDKPEPEPEKAIYPPPEDLAFKLIQQRSDWIKAGRDEEDY